MIRISKILLFFCVTALLAWALPWAYGFLGGAAPRTPFTLYSSVSGRFVWLESSENGPTYHDATGATFTEREFDSLLPFFYYRQLVADNRFPDSVRGVAVTPRMAQSGSFMFRSSPRDLNTTGAGIYPMLESMSGRVDLETPSDVFRIDDRGITFIDCATNAVDTEKSAAFTEMMRRKGFEFPARVIAGNPTTRKEYDEGFFLTDRTGGLFHLKQTVGRPYVRAVPLPEGLEVAHIHVTEFRGRQYYALLTDTAGQLYVLTTEDYALHPVEIPPVDLRQEGLLIVGNPLDWTLRVAAADGAEHYYAIDSRDFSRLAEWHYPAPAPSALDRAARWVFPFRLEFTSTLDTAVYPRLLDFSARALLLGALLATAYCLLRRNNPLRLWPQTLFVLLFGIYAFIGLLLFSKR